MEVHFFLGKGGVGKSTVSSLFALSESSNGKKTLLVSLDSAHNLCDIFEKNFSERESKINEKLSVIEVDTDLWKKKYLKETEKQFSDNYSYLSAYSLNNYTKIIQHSPGIEEYALFLAFQSIVSKYKTKVETLIFDMPPTALAVGFLSIPKNSLLWLKELKKLRLQIIKNQEIISKIKLGKREIETDKVHAKLDEMIDKYTTTEKLISSKNTLINLVTNQDKLSRAETLRIMDKLEFINKEPAKLFINKSSGESPNLYKNFTNHSFLPASAENLISINALIEYLKQNPEVF